MFLEIFCLLQVHKYKHWQVQLQWLPPRRDQNIATGLSATVWTQSAISGTITCWTGPLPRIQSSIVSPLDLLYYLKEAGTKAKLI